MTQAYVKKKIPSFLLYYIVLQWHVMSAPASNSNNWLYGRPDALQEKVIYVYMKFTKVFVFSPVSRSAYCMYRLT
jgi:hypothetical protein